MGVLLWAKIQSLGKAMADRPTTSSASKLICHSGSLKNNHVKIKSIFVHVRSQGGERGWEKNVKLSGNRCNWF
jgi:hypothetical protein